MLYWRPVAEKPLAWCPFEFLAFLSGNLISSSSFSEQGASTSVHHNPFADHNCQEDLYVFRLYFLATTSVNRPDSAFTYATKLGEIPPEAAGLHCCETIHLSGY